MTKSLDSAPHLAGLTAGAGLMDQTEPEHASPAAQLQAIFREAVELDADTVTFTSAADQLQAAILKNRSEVRSIRLDSKLLKFLCTWLYRRYSVFESQEPRPEESEANWKFRALVRLDRQILSLNLSKILRLNGSTHITLEFISKTSMEQVMSRLGFTVDGTENFLNLIDSGRGIFILSSPTADGLKDSITTMECLCGFRETNIIQDISVLKNKLDPSMLNIPALRGDDPVDAILKVRSEGVDFSEFPLIGSLSHGFVKRVCASCAREAAIDTSLLSQLPEILRSKLHGTFRIGRGCDKCGHSGYDGRVSIVSFIRSSEALENELASRADHSALIALAYDQGAVSLFEDGLEKINQGITSLEALYQCVKVLPAVYSKHLYMAASNRAASQKPLNVPDDFFVAADEARADYPVTGGQALAAKPSAIAHLMQTEMDQPVLPFRTSREKPLILVVEDDADQRGILEMLFTNAGYDISSAGDGVEAYQKIEELRPDIVVSDLMMPRMDGGQLVRKIRASEKFGRTPVLMLTVVSDVQKEYELLDLGADDYCEKTIQRKILLKRVENLLKRA